MLTQNPGPWSPLQPSPHKFHNQVITEYQSSPECSGECFLIFFDNQSQKRVLTAWSASLISSHISLHLATSSFMSSVTFSALSASSTARSVIVPGVVPEYISPCPHPCQKWPAWHGDFVHTMTIYDVYAAYAVYAYAVYAITRHGNDSSSEAVCKSLQQFCAAAISNLQIQSTPTWRWSLFGTPP